jgi:uncharacterized delta-60 repeat protein
MNRPRLFRFLDTQGTAAFFLSALVALFHAPTASAQSVNTHRATLVRASSQYFSAADSASLNMGSGSLTIEAWIKTTPGAADTQDMNIVAKSAAGDTAYQLALENGGYLFARVGTATVGNHNATYATNLYRSVQVDDGAWHHVALTYDQAALRIYVDGTLSAARTAPTQDGSATGTLNIGKIPTSTGYFDGSVDEVRLWGAARTAEQIRAGMFSEIDPASTGLRGYWKLNNALVDASGNANALTATNSPTFATNDLPFATSANQLEWCVDSDTKGLFRLNGDTVSAASAVTLTNTGGVTFAAGKFASGADFGTNNTTKGLTTSDPLGIDGGPITLSCWVKLNTEIASGVYTFVDQANNGSKVNYIIDYHFNGGTRQVGFHRAKPGVTDQYVFFPVSLGMSSYHLLTLSYDGTTLTGFLDGVPVGSTAALGNGVASGTAGLGIGIRNFSNGDRASALLDDVLISSRAVTAGEVMKYYGGIVGARFRSDQGDAVIRKSGSTWSAVRSATAGDSVNTAANAYGATEFETPNFNIYAPFLPFDTGPLPASGVELMHATLNVRLEDVSGSDGTAIVQTSQASWNGINADDFDQRGAVEGSVRRTTKTPFAYNEWIFNPAGLSFIARSGERKPASASAAGKTQLGLRWGKDLDNLPPTGRDFFNISTAGAANPPVLLVEYRAATPSAAFSITGTISATNPPPGTIRVTATPTGAGTGGTSSATPGYSLTGLTAGASFNISAYLDEDNDSVQDPLEWSGNYTGNPLLLDGDKTNINITLTPSLFSISGTVSASVPPPGAVRVSAASTTTSASATASLSSSGPLAYTILNLPGGQSYNVTAYLDINGNELRDSDEWFGTYPSNPVVLSGNETEINFNIAALVPGSVDTSFNVGANSSVYGVALQPDGKAVICGTFSNVSGVARSGIAQLNADGTLDPGFYPNANGGVYCVALQRDGKAVIGGTFTSVGGISHNYLARLNADGSLETAFTPNPNGQVHCAGLQPDGRIVIGGIFNNVGGVARNFIARVNPDGAIDNGFDPNPNHHVYSLACQTDGKTVIVGRFSSVGGVSRNFIARLNSDGTLDPSFNPNAGGRVYCVTLQPDGKILVGGDFGSVGGVTRSRIARLNTDGTLDTSFDPNANSTVHSLALQADGKLLICGNFSNVGGMARNTLARLNADGSLDSGFDPNANTTVFGVSLQSDGRILLGGSFTSVGGPARNYIARLNNSPASLSLTAPTFTQVRWLRGGAAPELLAVDFEQSINGGSSWAPLGSGSRILGGWELTGLSLSPGGLVRARGRTFGGYYNASSGFAESVAVLASEIGIEQPIGVKLIDGSASIAFGTVFVGLASSHTFTVRNTGGTPLTGIGMTIDGVDAAHFSVPIGLPSTLSPGGSTTFTVYFSPTAAGAKSAVLHIASNDTDESSFDIALTGQGADSTLDDDSDGLTNMREFLLGTNPNVPDSDGDGFDDGFEVSVLGTNPLLADTDGDGLPDAWEVSTGLDPRRDDAGEDRDFDFVSNRDEYNGGVNSTNPNSSDHDNNGVSDYVQKFPGQNLWEALYDRTDRLLGVRHARGASFAYRYDGNSNLTRQIKLGLDTDHDGLSDLWEFAHGLDHNSANGVNGATGDDDADGWTNLQEQLGNSDPKSASSQPGANGTVVGSLTAPFVPTNFVSAAGQLDGGGAEEIVVGANGDPVASANFIRIYKDAGTAWTFEEVSIADTAGESAYGVTSIAVGQITGRRPAIYLGLRKTGGTGRVVELMKGDTGTWQRTLIVEGITDTALVHGLRTTTTGTDLMLGLAPRFGPDGALYRAAFEGGVWKTTLFDAIASHRGAGVIAKSQESSQDRLLRLLDAAGVQVASPNPFTSFDDFDDGVFPSVAWVPGGSESGSSRSRSIQESGGMLRLDATWGTAGSAANSAYQWADATITWLPGFLGIEISVPNASHTTGGTPVGNAFVSFGGTVLYSSGGARTDTNILIQVLKMDTEFVHRHRINNGAWTDWSNAIGIGASSNLHLEAGGGEGGSSGTANLTVDYIRFVGVSDLLAPGASISDKTLPSAAYRASTNTWYFKTPNSQTWMNAQLYAVARGGNLATADSADANTWLQGKFTGAFWLGYYRNFSSSSWRWLSGSTQTYDAFTPPAGNAPDQFFAYSNSGVWAPSTGSDQLRAGVFEAKAGNPRIITTLENEPVATAPLAWPGRRLGAGRFNATAAPQISAIEVFIDDKETSGIASAGDELVVGERVLGSSPSALRTDVRKPLGSGPVSAAYGFATFRPNNGTSDLLAIGEPTGEVSAWLASAPGGALHRKILSVAHTGKSWHALERIAMGAGTNGLAGLRVTPDAPQTADIIFWSPYELGFSTPPIIQQSAPSARISASPSSGGANALVNVRLWDSEGNLSRVSVQYKNPPGTGPWQSASLLTIAGQPAASNPPLPAPPTGATHAIVWNAVQDLGASFSGGVLLRAQGTDPSGAGAWSEPMYYTVNVTGDADGDGMPDGWEITNSLNPNDPGDASLDQDGDGASNEAEFIAGTNPTSGTSVLRITSISRNGSVVTLAWSSVAGTTYIVQSASTPEGPWGDLPASTVTAAGSTQAFPISGVSASRACYRIRVAP